MEKQKYLFTPIQSDGKRLRSTEFESYSHSCEGIARSEMYWYSDGTLFRVENSDTNAVEWFRKVDSGDPVSMSALEKVNEQDVLNLLYGNN